MPSLDCSSIPTLAGYASEGICDAGAGILRLWVANFSDVDWAASTITAGVITAIAMVATKTFFEVQLNDSKNAFFNATYSEDSRLYEVLATFFLTGGTSGQLDFINSLFNKCLVAYVKLGNCKFRMIGVDQDEDGIMLPPTPLKVSRHLDSSGQLGDGSSARNEFDLKAEQFGAPLFGTVTADNVPV